MSWYILGAYFSPMLPILTGAKENIAWPGRLLWATVYLFLSVRLVKSGTVQQEKMYKVFFSFHRRHAASLFVNLLSDIILSCMKEIEPFVQSVAKWDMWWGEHRSRAFMNLIGKFYLDLTVLWCLSVVSTTRVRYRKFFVTSMLCASRQLLHWAAPSAAAQWH